MGLLTASVRELTNARALDTAIVDANGDQITTFDVNVLTTPAVAGPTTGTLTSVGASTTAVTLLASNVARKGFTIYNDSARTLKVGFLITASLTATNFSVLLAAGGFYESLTSAYTGEVSGIWNVVNGSARMTELT